MPVWAFSLLLIAVSFTTADDSTIVELKGYRKVRGEITTSAGEYVVTVNFPPVRVFDTGTNDEINRNLGREYALRVLAKHLAGNKDLEFEVASEELRKAVFAGDSIRMTVAWPKTAVRLSPQGGKSFRKVSPAVFNDTFFTAKQDQLDTLVAVSTRNRELLREVRDAVTKARPEERRRTLARGIAIVEERGLAALDLLESAVKGDRNLLDTTERPEVITSLVAARKKFLGDLKVALDDVEQLKTPAFKDVQIDKPFETFLRANLLLMDLGGGAVVEDGPGEMYLIGVAKTLLKDGSPADVLRAERVSTLKARTAAVGERDGARITYLKRVEDRVVIVKDTEGEKSNSVSERVKLISESIEGIAKDLPIVGRWNSSDGKALYIAVGGRLPNHKKRQ